MSKKVFQITDVTDIPCPLCIETDGRKAPTKPVFEVSSDGGYSGPCCAPHLAALIKAQEKKEPERKESRPVPTLPSGAPQPVQRLPADRPNSQPVPS